MAMNADAMYESRPRDCRCNARILPARLEMQRSSFARTIAIRAFVCNSSILSFLNKNNRDFSP